MTLHRSALLFYLPFPAFYCSTLSPFHRPNSRFTLSSFHLSTVQETILTSYTFTFPSFKSSFFTFNPSPFHHPNRHFSLLPPHLSTFKQPHLIGHPLLWRGLGRPPFWLREALFLQPNIPQRGTRHKPIEVHMSLYATHFASFRELPDVMSACTFYLWTTRIVLSKEKKVRIEAWSKM